MSDINKLNGKLARLEIERRNKHKSIENTYNYKRAALYRQYNIPPKHRATEKELTIMVEFVLRNGIGGKTIRLFVKDFKKTEEWQKDVTNSKPKKTLIKVLDNCKDFHIIKSMKENKIYNEKIIVSGTLTGALRELSKQVNLCKEMERLNARIAELESSLAARNKGEDWRSRAIELKEKGYSVRKIAITLGEPKSTIGDFLGNLQKLP